MVALLFAVATLAPQAWAEGAVEPLGWDETNAGNASGVLIVAVRGVPPSLDPHWDSTTDTRDIAWHVFEALFTLDDAYDVVPMLAESYEVSEDAKHWTIHLRRGVRFHDGDEMKAADVVASLRRWGQVAPAGKAFFEGVESIESVGEYAVQISLSRPNSALPAILSDTLQFAAIYPERIALAAGADRPIEEYVGTGPFKFVEKRPNGSIRLARFDEYTARSEPASGYGGRRTAAVGQLVFHPESSARGAACGPFGRPFRLCRRPIARCLPGARRAARRRSRDCSPVLLGGRHL